VSPPKCCRYSTVLLVAQRGEELEAVDAMVKQVLAEHGAMGMLVNNRRALDLPTRPLAFGLVAFAEAAIGRWLAWARVRVRRKVSNLAPRTTPSSDPDCRRVLRYRSYRLSASLSDERGNPLPTPADITVADGGGSMGRATVGADGQRLWRYVPQLPRPVFFYAGVYFACTAIWFVLWLLNARDGIHLALAGVFTTLGLAHVLVECFRARRNDRGRIGLDKLQDDL
jgi:hypothetical protein